MMDCIVWVITQIEQKQAQINNRNNELLLLSDKIKQTQFDHEKQLDDLASQLAQKEHLLSDKQNNVIETQNELDKMNEQSRKLTALIDKNQQHIQQQTEIQARQD
tara:strand:+ start:70 stop:384 length:315 start_codon:yes stop_codon:yes gene_type:complete